MRQKIEVYIDWEPLSAPLLAGVLSYTDSKRGGVFSFKYSDGFLASQHRQAIDPQLTLYSGELYNDVSTKNFRVFLDSSPDRWGRVLMQRRAAIEKRLGRRDTAQLNELDYLLGVHDSYRMGAIRFKREGEPEFLDNNAQFSAPPITSLPELAHAAIQIESDVDIESDEYHRWLQMLISPGSSLGGARPKACVVDESKDLWIAKFPNAHDTVDVGGWEWVCYELAVNAGINMSESSGLKVASNQHTFLTRRFDRQGSRRVHFSSAMTQLQYYDGEESYGASYLEIAEFLSNSGGNTKADLAELWRRIVFNISVSNTDDHLRNHGFLWTNKGWNLSPAFDLNPSIQGRGLHLNINDSDNSLDHQLAFEVREFFRLTQTQASRIYDEVQRAVLEWKSVSAKLHLSRAEQQAYQDAFRV